MLRSVIAIVALFGLVVLTVGAVLNVTAKQAHACSAPAPPPLIEVLEGSDFAFVGEVISIDMQEIKGEKISNI